MIRLIAIIILCLGLAGCGGGAHDARLSRIADSIDANPHGALAALDSIDASQLSEADRHYHDLLTVKSRDKAYVTHTSDSLILSVMQYYEHHDTDLYPEALYYGGRVYSDLGDFPTALRYFQDALSVTPDDNLDLLGRLYSQTGRLLNTLRQYRQAIPYIEKSLHLDSIQKDNFNLAYDHQLLGFIYKHLEDYDTASKYFDKSIEFGQYLLDEDLADLEIERAGIEFDRGNTSSALKIIRPLMPTIRGLRYALALNYASEIYYTAGIYDTAYLYARELSHQALLNNRKNGFYFLFQPELFRQIPTDSVNIYIKEYHLTIEEYLNKVDRQSVIQQNANYNYRIHERARTEAESENKTLFIYICVLICLVLICIINILIFRNKRQKTLIELHQSRDAIARLKKILNEEKSLAEESTPADTLLQGCDDENTGLCEQLQIELENFKDRGMEVVLPPELLSSDAYLKLQNFIKRERNISENAAFWNELEKTVLKYFPDFKKRLEILLGGNIKEHELQTVLLIKFGLNTKQMMILLGRTKTAISERRKNLSNRILGQKSTSSYIDAIIRLL